jgi:hypothetical protein
MTPQRAKHTETETFLHLKSIGVGSLWSFLSGLRAALPVLQIAISRGLLTKE